MLLVLDAHCHTIASGHAYSTLAEMAQAAESAGLSLLGITEHGPAMPGSCHPMYFTNYKTVDRSHFNIELLLGAELNILDFTGAIDVQPEYLRNSDLCLAGFHPFVIYTPGSRQENTAALLRAMQNEAVDAISHPEDARVPVDFDEAARAAADTGVLLEINNASLNPQNVRCKHGSRRCMETLLECCEKHGAFVLVSSDAHHCSAVGNFDAALALIEETGFPEALVVNTSVEKFKKHLHSFK